MTTIKLKNGSGAPDAADLVQGEVALDLTNKRIYSENASGTVIEMGTSPSTIDINAGTIDGTVIGGASAAAITGTTITGTSFVSSGNMTFGDNDKAIFGAGSDLQIYHDGSYSIIADAGTGHLKLHLRFKN
jgi:3D (Asp-Asp-Asp) domain-containing protein